MRSRCSFALLASLFFVQVIFCRAAEPSKGLQLSPIGFETNRGQAPRDYSFLMHRDGLRAMFLANGVDFSLCGKNGCDEKLTMSFAGGHSVPESTSTLAGHVNYFLGEDPAKWITNVPLSSAIEYKELYPGVSLTFYGNGKELEHDFRVAPGADVKRIALRLDGAIRIDQARDGSLEIHTANGALTLKKPAAYQEKGKTRIAVDASFLRLRDGSIGFRLGAYDAQRPLVIDPVIVFSTYLGGTGADFATAVTTDANGDVLVTGSTSSADFPAKNPLQSSLENNQSAFVTKLDPTGQTLIYSSYLGGSSQGGAIAVDANGNAIVAGLVSSANFPVAGAGTLPSCQINNSCFFVASLAPDGSKLNYSGTYGGEQGFYIFGTGVNLAVDRNGNAYVAGTTDNANFQITAGTLATSVQGYPHNETFVLKVDPTGKLVYSTVIPGNDTNSTDLLQPYTNDFIPTGIVVDGSGNATIAGTTGLGLPTTAGVVGPQFPNAYVNVSNPSAGFVLQLNPSASAINFASYLPGTDYNGGIAIGPTGNFYFAGGTHESNLPVSASAYQKAGAANSQGGYVMELNPQATSVLAATYLGVNYVPAYGLTAIALDGQSNIFIGGSATAQGFPLQNPFDTEYEYTGSIADLILAEISPDLSTLEFGSYLSSTTGVYAGSTFAGLAVDHSNNLVVSGTTFSSSFPTTAGSFEPQLPPPANPQVGYQHSFVAKFDMGAAASARCYSTFSVAFGSVNANSSVSRSLSVTNCGNAPLTISSIASSDPTVKVSTSCGTVAVGASCPVNLTFTPLSNGPIGGTITFTDNAQTIPQSVSFNGQGVAPSVTAYPTQLSLGHYVVGAAGSSKTLQIQNIGSGTLNISAVTVSGAGFSISNNSCTGPVPAGLYCFLQIAFAPTGQGSQSGSVTVSSNDPLNPSFAIPLTGYGDSTYSVPVITSIGAGTLPINSGSQTVQITGSNFYPQSVVQVAGVPQTTTFFSNTSLSATIAASSLTSIGELNLSVMNPSPGGGFSASATLTPYRTLIIGPTALVSVPATGMIYAAIPAGATTNPNTVIPINPATGTAGAPIAVGQNPSLLAASSDGSYLYVANQGNYTLQRINLQTNSVDRTFAYPPNPSCPTCSLLRATDLAAVPGSPQQVVLAQGSVLALYNDSGMVNYVWHGSCCYAEPDFESIALAGSPMTVYGLPFTIFQNPYFQVANLTPSGLQYIQLTGTNFGGNNSTGAQLISDGTLLYTSAGQVWNPATQTKIGTFPVTSINITSYPNMRALTLDTSLGEIYWIGYQNYTSSNGSLAGVISAYGISSYALTGTLAFPQMDYPDMGGLVRWGTDGLAFIGPGSGLTDQELYILRSSVVSPQTTNPTPVLNSISPTSALASGAQFTLTVNGSGFLPSSVVEWNQTPLPTSYVNSQQLTATVPASDLAAVGTAQVAVFSPAPGGGSSAATAFTINPAGTSIALTINPAGNTLTSGSSYTLSATVTSAPGAGVPAGNVVFTIGSTTQTVALNASGIATYSGTAPGTAGSLAISAQYQGSANFLPSSSPTLNETIVSISTSIALTASNTQISSGSNVTLTATVTPSSGTASPTGSVDFHSGSSVLQSAALSNGVATITTASLPVGANIVSATYAGAGSFGSSVSNTVTINVVPPNPTPAVGNLSPTFATAGSAAFTLTVNGSGFISGSTVYWGAAALTTQFVSANQLTAQVQSAQVAAAGINAITVQSPSPGGGVSNTVQFEVDTAGSGSGPSFAPTSASIARGASASYSVTLPASATNISVTCLNLPTGATCSYSASTSTLTITTSSSTPIGTYVITAVFTETLPGAAAALLLLSFLRGRSRREGRSRSMRVWLLICTGVLVLWAANGCGSGGGGAGGTTAPVTHQVTSSGSFSLTVQ
jgi:hypothetical protein